MNTEERVTRIEETMLLMKELLLRHETRIDDWDEKFKRSREDFEFKMNALIDAQMKNEAEIDKLNRSTTELRESTRELKDASRYQLTRIEKLEAA